MLNKKIIINAIVMGVAVAAMATSIFLILKTWADGTIALSKSAPPWAFLMWAIASNLIILWMLYSFCLRMVNRIDKRLDDEIEKAGIKPPTWLVGKKVN